MQILYIFPFVSLQLICRLFLLIQWVLSFIFWRKKASRSRYVPFYFEHIIFPVHKSHVIYFFHLRMSDIHLGYQTTTLVYCCSWTSHLAWISGDVSRVFTDDCILLASCSHFLQPVHADCMLRVVNKAFDPLLYLPIFFFLSSYHIVFLSYSFFWYLSALRPAHG